MILMLILVAVAILALAAAWKAVRGQTAHAGPQELMAQIRQVDLQAFRNLLDVRNEHYMRQHVSPNDFRRWQKLRTKAALEYVNWIFQNASVLLAIGAIATRSSDRDIAVHGKALSDVALSLRINCILASCKLYLGLVFPSAWLSIDSVIDGYAETHESFVSLRFAQNPASVSKVASF